MIVFPELPVGWTPVHLGDVIHPRKSKASPAALPEMPFIGLEHVEAHTSRIIGQATTRDVRSSVALFRLGDVLYGRLRPYLNKVVRPNFEGTSSAEFIVFPGDSNCINPEFLRIVLMSRAFQDFTADIDRGDRPRVKWEQIAEFPFALPPMPEQKRIGERVQMLLLASRNARDEIRKASALRDLLERRLPSSVFDGDHYSAQMEGDLPLLDLPPYDPPARFTELPEIPDGWKWAEMKSLADVTGGVTKNQNRGDLPMEMPYLRVANVYADELRLADVSRIRVSAREAERTLLHKGDLLVVEGNGSIEQIGRAAEWDGCIEPCVHQNHIIRVRPHKCVPGRYLLQWLMSPGGRHALETVASSSSGLHTLSLTKVSAIPVPVPPIPIMPRMAQALDISRRHFRSIANDLRRATSLFERYDEQLRTEAMEGALLPQDSSDETAEALIARAGQIREKARAKRAVLAGV